MSIEDLRSCYQGEVADEDTGEVHGKFLLTYATIGSMYYYTFIVERAKISDSSICYSVVNVESGLEVLSITFTGVSWSSVYQQHGVRCNFRNRRSEVPTNICKWDGIVS